MRLIDADALAQDLDYDVEMCARALDRADLVGVERERIQLEKDCKQNCMWYLSEAETVDAVPVVRCGECVHRDDRYEWHGDYNCRLRHEPKSLDFFCSDGKRREDGET